MSIGTRIKERREELGITQVELAEKLGVTKGAVGNYETDRGSPKASMLYKVFDVLDCDANYIFQDERKPSNAAVTSEEVEHIKKYRALDKHGRRAVDAIISIEAERTETPTLKKVIPLFGASFAAGVPEPDFGNMWTDYEVPAESSADFAIRVTGERMEPYLHDGDIALGTKRQPADGDVAALMLDGCFLVKQVCQDNTGRVYLFSLNRSHKDIIVSAEQNLMSIGTILMPKRLPLPKDMNV